MSNEYKTLESIIKDMYSSVPLLKDADWRYSRICTTIRNVYEKKAESREEADEKGYDEDDLRIVSGSEEEKTELRRNKKAQQKIKQIDIEGN
jgi:hypothetical protein